MGSNASVCGVSPDALTLFPGQTEAPESCPTPNDDTDLVSWCGGDDIEAIFSTAACDSMLLPTEPGFVFPPLQLPAWNDYSSNMSGTLRYQEFTAPSTVSGRQCSHDLVSSRLQWSNADLEGLVTNSSDVWPALFGDLSMSGGGYIASSAYESNSPLPLNDLGTCGGMASDEWTYRPSSGTPSLSGDSTRDDDEARFSCSECLECFPTYYTLEAHARSTAHRAYRCPKGGCSCSYHRRDVYVRHLQTHRESGLHICKVCERADRRKTFKRKDHLKQHVRNIHPEEPMRDAIGKTPSSRSSSVASTSRVAAALTASPGNRLTTDIAKERSCRHGSW